MPSEQGEGEGGDDTEYDPHGVALGPNVRGGGAVQAHDVVPELRSLGVLTLQPLLRHLIIFIFISIFIIGLI